MKTRVAAILMSMALIVVSVSPAFADPPVGFDSQGNETAWKKSDCANIQSGNIHDSAGNPLSLGYDEFGYNYQAHMFNGTYDSVDRNLDGTFWGQTGDFVDDRLSMKWSDDWLSNVDCDGDGLLDRGDSGISLGWETNHVEGEYLDADGNVQHYTDFVKIVWTGPGSPLWGQYTVVEEVFNDPAGGLTGLYSKLGAPGFGLNDQWTTLP
jgi:hypothetical protein